MSVRIGVIGTGNMGADHIRNLQRFVAGSQVTVVADYDRATAEAVARWSGARVAVDGHALITDPEVDAVIIASHDSTHYTYALASVAARKPTLCEKPLAPTLAECEEIVAAEAAAGGNLLSLGFMRRFDPAHTELKAAIDAGVIGPVLRVTGASRNVVGYPDTTSERIITNSVIHELDSIPWLLGSPVTSVAWLAGRATSKVPEGVADPSLTLLRTADGVLTSVDMYVNAEYGYDLRTEVLGEKGALSLTDPALVAVDLGRQRSTGVSAGLAAPVRRRLPARARRLGRGGGRGSSQPTGQCHRRVGREPGGGRCDHLDARGWPLGRGRSMTLPSVLPAARTPDPRSAPSLRWGVIGTGWIADRFVSSLQQHSSQRVVAVGSRTQESARAFADRHSIAAAYGSYEELVADEDVDVVYVATPHNAHLPVALLSLGAGKHTLVEKPLGATAEEARQIAAAAETAGVFCMEAMWTAFLPKFDVLRQLLPALGTRLSVVADFGEWFAEGHRILKPELAGGPLLDLGTYLVAFALDVLGPTESVMATGQRIPSGVLGQVGALLAHHGGRQSVLHTTLLSNTPTTAVIAGSEATLVIDGPFYQPGGFTLEATDGSSLRYDEESIGHEALHFQAAEVARRISGR